MYACRDVIDGNLNLNAMWSFMRSSLLKSVLDLKARYLKNEWYVGSLDR